jgi:hypothetical protein
MLVTLGHNLRDGAILPEYEAFGWAIIEIAHQRYRRQFLRIGLDRAGDRGSQPHNEFPSLHAQSSQLICSAFLG